MRVALNPYEPVPDRKPYERQPKETEKAFQAFTYYRDLGFERTIEKATVIYRDHYGMEEVEYGNRILQGWSSKFGWVIRAEAWDRRLDAEKRKLQLKDIERMRQKHILLAEACQDIVVAELKKFKHLAKTADFRTISASELTKILEVAVKLERQSKGEPDQIIEERTQITVEDKRKDMRALLNRENMLDELDEMIQRANSQSDIN